jgi:hypothetical protein
MVLCGIEKEPETWSPIFEKCSHLRGKGGVLTLSTPIGFMLTHTAGIVSEPLKFRAVVAFESIQRF